MLEYLRSEDDEGVVTEEFSSSRGSSETQEPLVERGKCSRPPCQEAQCQAAAKLENIMKEWHCSLSLYRPLSHLSYSVSGGSGRGDVGQMFPPQVLHRGPRDRLQPAAGGADGQPGEAGGEVQRGAPADPGEAEPHHREGPGDLSDHRRCRLLLQGRELSGNLPVPALPPDIFIIYCFQISKAAEKAVAVDTKGRQKVSGSPAKSNDRAGRKVSRARPGPESPDRKESRSTSPRKKDSVELRRRKERRSRSRSKSPLKSVSSLDTARRSSGSSPRVIEVHQTTKHQDEEEEFDETGGSSVSLDV